MIYKDAMKLIETASKIYICVEYTCEGEIAYMHLQGIKKDVISELKAKQAMTDRPIEINISTLASGNVYIN
jgi:hypothetical protein